MAKNGAELGALFEEITVGDPPPMRLQLTRVDVMDVRLDPKNPRLRYQQILNPGKSLAELLFEENDTRLLKEDIRVNGLIDPPYLRSDGDGKYTVIEGNRRSACLQALRKQFPEDSRFMTMAVRVLPPDAPEKKQALLMASMHVAGKVKWSAHEKAGHIYDMRNRLQVSDEQLKATLHMGLPAIKQAIEAYEMLTERYAKIDNEAYSQQAEGRWSFFAEVFKLKPLRDKVMRDNDGVVPDPFFADQFCRWVGEGRLPRAEDVRKLPAILASDRAKTIFLSHRDPGEAFAKAVEASQLANPASKSKFFRAVKELVSAGLAANMEDIMIASSNDTAKRQLTEARNVLDGIVRQASVAGGRQ